MKHNEALTRVGLTMTEVRRNIRTVYGQRTDEAHEQGLTWYDEAMKLGHRDRRHLRRES